MLPYLDNQSTSRAEALQGKSQNPLHTIIRAGVDLAVQIDASLREETGAFCNLGRHQGQ